MKTALLAIALSGCAADGSYNDTLPHDTYYTQPPNQKLSLCESGTYAHLVGDVLDEGSYHLEGATVVASSFTFDLSSRVMDGSSDPWTVVTFVGDVDCTYNAP